MSWFSDLVDTGITALKNHASQAVTQSVTKTGNSVSAHIPAQNQVVIDFGAIIDAFNNSQISTDDAIRRVQTLDAGFTTYVHQLGYQRALQGGQDVHALASRVVAD